MGQYFNSSNLLTLPVFLLIITVLGAAHEYGNYLLARIFKMGIEEFAIGFGRKPLWIYGKKKHIIPVKDGQLIKQPSNHPLADRAVIYQSPAAGIVSLEGSNPEPGDIKIVDTPTGKGVEETTNFTFRPWPLGG